MTPDMPLSLQLLCKHHMLLWAALQSSHTQQIKGFRTFLLQTNLCSLKVRDSVTVA